MWQREITFSHEVSSLHLTQNSADPVLRGGKILVLFQKEVERHSQFC